MVKLKLSGTTQTKGQHSNTETKHNSVGFNTRSESLLAWLTMLLFRKLLFDLYLNISTRFKDCILRSLAIIFFISLVLALDKIFLVIDILVSTNIE